MAIDDYRGRIASITARAIGRAADMDFAPQIDIPKNPEHGDFSTAAALGLAKSLRKKPREIAENIVKNIQENGGFLDSAPVIEGPGFINFRISDRAWRSVIDKVIEQDRDYGRSDVGQGEKVMVEFVSANPTGPLHIGHARGAAVGDSMARLLDFTGHKVTKEFYVNDAGAQVDMLAKTAHARWLESQGIKVDWEKIFPDGNYYPGDYVASIAAAGMVDAENISKFKQIPAGKFDESERLFAASKMLGNIEKDLKDFGVDFDVWFRESLLYKTDASKKALETLEKQDDIYNKDDAIWFKVSKYEKSEEDRVIKKSTGEWTYFAGDITYHKDKLDRGFGRLINVWGADHHGYIGRVRAALMALGFPPDHLQVLLVQMVNLVRDGKPVRMGKRTGEFVTLREVLDEVGSDAMRFTFLSRSPNSQLDFDIDALKMKPGEDSEAKMGQLREKNPVYYVQYAHARSHAIFRKAKEMGVEREPFNLDLLVEPEEIDLARKLERFPREVAQAARDAEPHRVSHFLLDLAGDFHRYYYKGDKDKSFRVLSEDVEKAKARMALVAAVATVIRNGLGLLGVESPEKM